MIIRSINGDNIIETGHKTMRAALEYCALEGIDLSGADLRKARCTRASLDGLIARDACLWGADFTAADIGLADLRGADLRRANFKDACLAESDLSEADLQGAYFAGTIIDGAKLDGTILSCPSFWSCDLQSAGSYDGLVYNHLGERHIVIDRGPLVIQGMGKRLVLSQDFCLWGNDLFLCAAERSRPAKNLSRR